MLVAMTAIAIFSALTIFLQFKFTRERVTEEQMSQGAEEEKTVKTASLKEQLSAVTSEKMWWIVYAVLHGLPVERRYEERFHDVFL